MLVSPLISIVDDNQPFRDSMRTLVGLLGYTVATYSSARAFLASRLLLKTACLIADVHMPEMTGVELFGHLLKLGHPIPTILVTAYSNDAVRNRALQDGVVCYLSKPLDDEDLERCLQAALSRHAN